MNIQAFASTVAEAVRVNVCVHERVVAIDSRGKPIKTLCMLCVTEVVERELRAVNKAEIEQHEKLRLDAEYETRIQVEKIRAATALIVAAGCNGQQHRTEAPLVVTARYYLQEVFKQQDITGKDVDIDLTVVEERANVTATTKVTCVECGAEVELSLGGQHSINTSKFRCDTCRWE